jgi:hypothetical protein
MAGPISYELDGVQYVAVLAGFGGAMKAIQAFIIADEANLRE